MSRPVTPRETLCRRPEPVLSRSACFSACFGGFFFSLCVRPCRRSLLAFLSLVSALLLFLLSLFLFSPLLWSWRGLRFLALGVVVVVVACPVLFFGTPFCWLVLCPGDRFLLFHGPAPCRLSPVASSLLCVSRPSFVGPVPYSI